MRNYRTILFVFAAMVLSAVSVRAAGPPAHRVITANIRVALEQDEETGNGWSTRKGLCIEVLRRYNADIYCLQEVLRVQDEDLKEAFPDYMVLGFPGPEMDRHLDDGYHGIAKNPIMFRRDRYDLVAAGTYWLSETPHIGGSTSWETARARNANWVRLKERATGKEFRVISVHLDHVSNEAKLAQIGMVCEEAAQYPDWLPQILAGDFNARPTSPVIAGTLSEGWNDTFIEANGSETENTSTHMFRGGDYEPKKPGRIDYIFTRGGKTSCRTSQFIKDGRDGKYPSDHYFLYADISIE